MVAPVPEQQSVVVVGVGAARGLGAAICRRAAASGATVYAAGRTLSRLEELAEDIAARGGRAVAVATDTTREEQVAALFDRVQADASSPPVLVAYNAGNAVISPFVDTETAVFEKAWKVGCLGGFLVGREAARRMLPAGGTISFTGASASLRGSAAFGAFAAAKAGLRMVAQSMARELGPKGLHVVHMLVDGGIAGERLLSRFPDLAEQKGESGMLDPDAIADALWNVHLQPRSAWTHELDLRPWSESF
jgi:NAD(P)-dependent dehydrogenase (short-subunit alcohol dehydrogenase family)